MNKNAFIALTFLGFVGFVVLGFVWFIAKAQTAPRGPVNFADMWEKIEPHYATQSAVWVFRSDKLEPVGLLADSDIVCGPDLTVSTATGWSVPFNLPQTFNAKALACIIPRGSAKVWVGTGFKGVITEIKKP